MKGLQGKVTVVDLPAADFGKVLAINLRTRRPTSPARPFSVDGGRTMFYPSSETTWSSE